ncbi:MAG: Amidohydrolase [Thermoproteota archaeon]|nr:Amidohydrolase [Thermoproteota archaeon]
MSRLVKVAAIQSDPKILEVEKNLDECLEFIKVASKKDAKLIVFPECSLTGYCFSSFDEVMSVAETIPGRNVNIVSSLCKELGVYVVIGLVEREGDKCFNSLSILGPKGFIGKYRKLHLPYLGLDRFVSHGDIPLRILDTEVGKLGGIICFDTRFPEAVRILALLGAEIIVLPTNWPKGADLVPKYVINTRAYENRVHYIAANRVGRERGFRFIGHSKIVHCSGVTLAEASISKEEIIYAQLSPEESREKHVVIKKNEFELPLFKERRPELYELICKKI